MIVPIDLHRPIVHLRVIVRVLEVSPGLGHPVVQKLDVVQLDGGFVFERSRAQRAQGLVGSSGQHHLLGTDQTVFSPEPRSVDCRCTHELVSVRVPG
jgi:hypothetical protein